MDRVLPSPEQLTSFDIMASVDMFRFDIQVYGEVLPETRQRVYDEELSLMAEGVERAAKTDFTLRRQGGELVYFDNGQWRPYVGMMLETGLQVARSEAVADPRRAFLLEWAERDMEMGLAMQALRPGEQLVWHNGYPFEVERRFGAKFLRECGLFPDRAMGFIYRATCDEDGNVRLESQTVDRSDADGFAAIERLAEYDQSADMETLVRTYDGQLKKKYGGHFYAGRTNAEMHENAWSELQKHLDLMAYFMNGLEEFAQSDEPRGLLRRKVIQHIVGCWKAFKTRLDRRIDPLSPMAEAGDSLGYIAFSQERLAMEVHMAFESALRSGEIKSGCGGSLSAEDLWQMDAEKTYAAIFGGQAEDTQQQNKLESYGFDKVMFCLVCQAPPKENERKKLCGPCGICEPCDAVLKRKESKV